MLAALFASVADAIISYTVDKLDPAERIKPWLKRDPVKLAFQKSLARAYSAFARQYPDYANSLFDETFLTGKAVPELSKLLIRNQHPDPALLAHAWRESVGAGSEFATRGTIPAADFLLWLEAELKSEQALQLLFDSRALDNIEAGIEKLTQEIQRGLEAALKSANGYQIQVGGNVTNSNIIVGDNNTVNQYFYSGDFISLNDYYIPPDGVFQRVRVDEFVGRDWLTAKVDAFLNDPKRKSGAFLLIGDAGVGKTAFLAHLVKERRYIHLFAEQVPGPAMLQRALQSLGSQVVTRYQIDPYKDRDTLTQLAVFPDFLERLLRLATSTLTNGEKIVIVCDALDEAGVFPDHFVFGLPKELPDGVYFILSQRPVNVKLPNFEPMIEKLEAQGEDNLQDIDAYLSAVAKRPEIVGQIRSKGYPEKFFIQTLTEKSQGVWMYLHYIVREIESGTRAPLDLASLPIGLVGYYAEYWDAWRTGKRGKGEDAWDELYAPLLTTLAATQEAIPMETLIQWADVASKPREVTRLLNEHWRAFITEKEVDGKKVYAPYHLSFKDFITGRVDISKLAPTQANLIKDLAAQTLDAHKRILKTFETECGGEWEKLVEQDYPRLHLTAHLQSAGEFEKLRILLTEGDEKIKWAEARETKEETYAGYLNDLSYVWEYAEREQNYVLAIRCMLIENSIRSLAMNISPELLVQLGKTGLWSYPRCLSIIRDNPDPSAQAQSLELIALDLPPLLLQEALSAAREIEDGHNRIRALVALAPCLNDELKASLLQEALSATWKIEDGSGRGSALRILAPLLKDGLKRQALSVAWKIEDSDVRAETLGALAPHLNDELKAQALQEALSAAWKIEGGYARGRVLNALAIHLNDELKAQALSAALEIEEYYRASTVVDLAQHLNDKLKAQALSATREIEDDYRRARSLGNLAPHLTDELKKQAIHEALLTAGKIENDYDRAVVLGILAPHLNDELKTQVLHEALSAAGEIESEQWRTSALRDLAPHLIEELRPLALSIAREIKAESERAIALGVLVPYLNDELKAQVLHDALLATHEIENAYVRAKALQVLAPQMSEELKVHELSITLKIRSGYSRIITLQALVPHLNNELKADALQEELLAAHEIENGSKRASVLLDIALQLNDELKAQVLLEALVASREIKEAYHAEVLGALAPYLNDELKVEALQKALSGTQEIMDGYIHGQDILGMLAPQLNEELKAQALSVVLEFEIGSARTHALETLWPYLNDELKAQALSATQAIENKSDRVHALWTLMPHLNNELKTRAIQETLSTTREIEDGYTCANVLKALAPYLNDELKAQALSVAGKIEDAWSRAGALEALVPYLSNELKTRALKEALSAAQEIKSGLTRVLAVRALMPYLNDELKTQALQEALSATHKIEDGLYRVRALGALAPHLNHELKAQTLQEALSVARHIEDAPYRFWALHDLIPELNHEFKAQALQDALSAIWEIRDEHTCTRALEELAPYLNNELKTQALSIAGKIENGSQRAHALKALVPRLTDEQKALALSAARQIKDEFFRASALADLGPYLNDELKTQALSAALEIESESWRAMVLGKLAPNLNDELKTEALSEARKIENGYARVHALSDLAIYVDDEIKAQVLQEALSATQEIKSKSRHAGALESLTQHLNAELQFPILEELLYSRDDALLQKALDRWKQIEFDGLQEHIILAIRSKSQEDRKRGVDMVGMLIPALIHFSGSEIVPELYRAIQDTARWWP
jgi:hypothetical protein